MIDDELQIHPRPPIINKQGLAFRDFLGCGYVDYDVHKRAKRRPKLAEALIPELPQSDLGPK